MSVDTTYLKLALDKEQRKLVRQDQAIKATQGMIATIEAAIAEAEKEPKTKK